MPEYVERQLAHKTKTTNGNAYDRAMFQPQRRQMMQKWADYLDQLKINVQVALIDRTEAESHLRSPSQAPRKELIEGS